MAKEDKQEDSQELQQKYMQFQMFQQQIEQVQKQLQMIDKQLVELETVKQGVEDLKTVKTGTEILVPVSSGIFVKAELKDNKNVTVNVGSNVAAEKTMEQAKKLIDDQSSELTNVKQQLTEDVGKLNIKAANLQAELQQLVG